MTGNGFTKSKDLHKVDIGSSAFLVAVLISLVLSAFFASSFFLKNRPLNITLNSLINPNYAPSASLARLPGIGLVRAQAIVGYRNDFRSSSNTLNEKPFANCDDLKKIKGIGPKTAKAMSPWLRFE